MKTKVYIAGPYTYGDVAVNVRSAIHVANKLMDLGYAVFVPHLSHFQHMLCPRPYEYWIEHDKEWLKACDVMVRLPGPSTGADLERDLALSLKIPVFALPESLSIVTFDDWWIKLLVKGDP